MAEMKKTAAKETVEPVEKITAKADALKIDTKEPEPSGVSARPAIPRYTGWRGTT